MIFSKLLASAMLGFASFLLAPSALAAGLATEEVSGSFVEAGLNPAVLSKALKAYEEHQDVVENERYIGIIDYTRHSSEPRFFVHDLETGETEVLLVSHGRGSDAAHTGRPVRFSNTPGSKMTSVGAYVTAETYHGKHGLSLRLDGLSETNSRARERAIVIHGADYVAPGRTIGRSWGCPAVERRLAGDLIEKFKGGAFLYIHGEEPDELAQVASAS
ncbi:murein L,D-transpeptidase catalytic domain family protein [Parvularcula lutaonensis]|uniref:Murein L,D-transpeptidase catalytic domain family protein n=1 Tax=Parvularcula lutaonensis TaxID=491923 RepID=A0ABV7M9B9_9PROT|nr:murein L,D-transpeptidase catalytic domain family protein [Parvularcula lutaonensis]GGY41976.1 hypothetical protein GCM10007148_08260 [Parvularcula lutaonensis]